MAGIVTLTVRSKASRDGDTRSETTRSTTSMSSREKAEQKLRELTAIMGDSDHDDSEGEATDDEALLDLAGAVEEADEQEQEEEEEASEGEEQPESEEEQEENIEKEVKEDEGNDGSSTEETEEEGEGDEDSSSSEAEEEGNEKEDEAPEKVPSVNEHALVPVVATTRDSNHEEFGDQQKGMGHLYQTGEDQNAHLAQ